MEVVERVERKAADLVGNLIGIKVHLDCKGWQIICSSLTLCPDAVWENMHSSMIPVINSITGYGKGTKMLTGIGFDHQNMVQWGGVKWDLITQRRLSDNKFLEGHGYKVYSQNDEDGIIQEIFRRIGTTNKTFVEIGIQDGMECNTHYLLFLGWHGVWIEASEACADAIKRKFDYVINNGILKVINEFVTRENINDLLVGAELPEEVDLLSIDIDGNDYYIFEAISSVKPRVILIEYNGKFPPECSWKMPYCKDYIGTGQIDMVLR